ncbi:MAG: phosphopantetheine-binding protein [Thermodesulfovibrionales bacterium]
MDRTALVEELKTLIIRNLKLEDITPVDIDPAAPLFGSGLGLDSIDALELVVGLEKAYGIRIPDEDVGKEAFASVNALADYIIRSTS